MANRSDYTARAIRYTAKYPVLTYVGTQVNFWIVVNLLLTVVLNFQSRIIGQVFGLPASAGAGSLILLSVIMGIFYGVCLGLPGYYLERRFFKRLSLGRIIVWKTLGSVILLITILWVLRFILWDWIVPQSLYTKNGGLNDDSWRYLFFLLLTYYSFMTLMINFINQINKKYGPGVLLPLLLGQYRNPREEKRIFMFMDLKSSTTTAEKLGHIKYSAFIRDCFADINEMLFPFRAQVYQYVGDEIVIMWPKEEGVEEQCCIRFYFACRQQFRDKADYYKNNYGLVPEFKAGLHIGVVTAVEIGEIKKDIAYHGDTLNTAARIQSVCNKYNLDFLISQEMLNSVGILEDFNIKPLGKVLLRGKVEKISIVGIEDSPNTTMN